MNFFISLLKVKSSEEGTLQRRRSPNLEGYTKDSCSKCEECDAKFIKEDQELQKRQEVAKLESDTDKIQVSIFLVLLSKSKSFFFLSNDNKTWLLDSTTVKNDSRHFMAVWIFPLIIFMAH